MFNKKSLFTVLFLINLSQLDASQTHQKLHSATITAPTQPERALVGERSESRPVPECFRFKQDQTRTLEELPDVMKYIIGQYVGFDEPVNKNCNFDPFHYAISHRDGNAVQILVALKADWHDKKCKHDHQKTTVLHAAIKQYTFACNDNNSSFSLGTKKQKESLAIVDYLLRREIGINKIVNYEQTPIYEAIMYSHVNITQRLITAQADLTITDQRCRTPLDMARQHAMQPLNPRSRKKLYEICTILEQADAPSSVTLKRMPTDEIMNQEYTIACQEYERKLKRRW